MTNSFQIASPVLSLRIGITGVRVIAPEHRERIAREVESFLIQIRAHATEIARLPSSAHPFGRAERGLPTLKALSPLAEGSDRLLAHLALNQGFSLICPLPFALDDYESDFSSAESKEEFRCLLRQAGPAVIELDGARGDAEARSYEAVGRYVVRNCDILIAIWNGKPGRGLGGTTDVVRFAVHHGPPVWWIPAQQDDAPGWLIDGEDFRRSAEGAPRQGGNLRAYLEHLILPPTPRAEKPATTFERMAHLLKAQEKPSFHALAGRKRWSNSWIWRAHGWLIETMAGKAKTGTWSIPTTEPSDATAAYWFKRYRPTDLLATAYAQRYRSSYVWTFALAALALIAAAIALVVPSEVPIKLAVTGAELLCLVFIGTIVLANERQSWHRHFLEFRLFAELCRKQQALAPCGWSLQGPNVTDKSILFKSAGSLRHDGNWVPWLFGAFQRAAPPVGGRFDPTRMAQIREQVLTHLIDEQLSYHKHRADQSARANAKLGQLAEMSFFTVLATVIAKLVLVVLQADHEMILALGLCAAILPALSAGFVGIRSYAELSAIAEQSQRMVTEMTAARLRIERIEGDEPLSSQALGSEVFGVAVAMLRDIEGWIQLFSSKIVEPG